MSAAFSELGIRRMSQGMGALRQGVLYDLLGRFHKHDMRETTVRQFMQRYRVDSAQARRVESLALLLGRQLTPRLEDVEESLRILSWVARLHEIGISVAHSGYHRHSAYILGNADMPGFSKSDQERLSALALAHRGGIDKAAGLLVTPTDIALLFSLRLAALIYRSRSDIVLPGIKVQYKNSEFMLLIEEGWLEHNPLTQAALSMETEQWTSLGFQFLIRNLSPSLASGDVSGTTPRSDRTQSPPGA